MPSQATGASSTPSTEQEPPLTGRSAALLTMLVACCAVFLTALDQTVVVTALPSIIDDLQIPLQQLDRAAWIISAYLLGYVIAMPLMARISDLYGRRLVFLICLSVFGVASLFCGLATVLGNQVDITFLQHLGINVAAPGTLGDPSTLQAGLIWLVAARFVQASGGGAIVPVAMAIAGDYYGEKQRALALGLIGMVTEAGGVLGPLYGAAIVQAFSWHMIFYLNIPLVALLLIAVWFLVKPRNPVNYQAPDESIGDASQSQARWRQRRQHLDLAGTLLLGASLLCLSLGLSQEAITGTTALAGATNANPIQNNPWLIACAVLLFLAFAYLEILFEKRAEGAGGRTLPIIEPSLFRRLAFSATALVSLLIGASLIIAMADIPLFIATVQNGTALDSGLALLRLTVMIPPGAILGGWLCSHITCRLNAILGLLLTVVGFWLMHLWPIQVHWPQMTVSTLICGLGFGLVIAPISTTAINAVKAQQMGMAAAVVTVLRMIGMILGLAALTSWGLGHFYAIVRSSRLPANIKPFSAAYTIYETRIATVAAHDVYTSIFLAAGVLCLVAILPACLLEGRRPSPYSIRAGHQNEQ